MNATRPLGFWLKLVDSLIDEHFAATLDEHGVTRRQWQVLNMLEQHPATERSLIDALAPYFASADEPPSVSEHLAELVESGWIAHEGEYFSITERGSTSLSTLSELVDQIREQCGENLSEEQYATTVASLEQMARNLGWEPQTSPEAGT
ncbi:MarR family winged helix-turn-helix transcriptional regulator [Glutamicibacter sp. BSL13]